MDGDCARNITIGLLAHVDAGKTTFAEQILYHTGSIRRRGRVDHGDTFLDSHTIEKERGITVFSEQATFQLQNASYTLLDTPGHVDFSSEMERALRVMDYGVIIVSAAEGIQGHTETVWRLLRAHHIPTFFFLNKTDREGAQPELVLDDLHRRFSVSICDLSQQSEDTAEALAELDEQLMEAYCAGNLQPTLWQKKAQELMAEERLFPLFQGSALRDEGVDAFLQGVHALVQRQPMETDKPFCAEVYQVRHQLQGERLVCLKVLEGSLSAKEQVAYLSGGVRAEGKVNSVYQCQGKKLLPLARALPGMLCAAAGLPEVRPGDLIGAKLGHAQYQSVPLLQTKVVFPAEIAPQTALGQFRQLAEEEPLLDVEWNELLQELHIKVMGTVQLEVLRELVRERFGLAVEFGPCEVLYQETIAAPVVGYGHFEPLRHYAEVHVRLEPGVRGSGITFASECPLEVLDKTYQHLVQQHVFEKTHKGVLLGMPLTDVKIVLVNGRAHLKHTEGGDFREATYRAIRQGLEQAQSVVLEPVYAVTAEVEAEQIGRVMSELEQRHCTFSAPETVGKRIRVQGSGPAACLMDYPAEFAAFTKGKGLLGLRFDGYQPCHNTAEVIERTGYDRTRDMENTSSSVFCKKGAGFEVKWDQVPQMIHCK